MIASYCKKVKGVKSMINKNRLNLLDTYLTQGGSINSSKPISNKLLRG